MTRMFTAVALAVMTLAPPTSAQLLNKTAPVIVGHYHLNVTSVDAHKKFWVDTLGGTAIKFGRGLDVIKFPDVFIFLNVQPPTGPTRGTAFDHIGFAVPDVPALTTKVVANGYQLTVGREPAPGQTVSLPTAGNYGRFSYLLGPGRREGRAGDEHGSQRAAHHAPPRALHQQAVRRNAAVVHEGLRRDAAARANRLLHRRRSSRCRVHAQLLPLGRRPEHLTRTHQAVASSITSASR